MAVTPSHRLSDRVVWLVGRAFRRAYLVSDSCWLLFGVLAGSTAGWVAAMISLCLNLWTMRREREANAATQRI